MRVLEREYLPRSASPEEAGVSSVAVAAFMEELKAAGIENFIHVRVNVLDTLKEYNAKLGIK